MKTQTDKSLVDAVTRAKSGDTEAFTFLYRTTCKNKYYVALKYMGNEADAEDVLQDAYIKAYKNIGNLSDPEKFDSWLSTIVANTAKNTLRTNKPMLFSDMTTDEESGETEFEDFLVNQNADFDPEEHYTSEETKELTHELLDSLPEEQRVCMIMFYLENLSVNEIAETLGCGKNTVTSRLNYGRKKIKARGEELEKKGYKLYGLSPVFLLILLLKQERDGLAAGAWANGTPADSQVLGTLKGLKPISGSNAVAVAKSAISLKKIIAATLISATIITGAVLFVTKNNKPENSNPTESKTTKTVQNTDNDTANAPVESATQTPTSTPASTSTPAPTSTPTPSPEETHYMDYPIHLTYEGEETGLNIYMKKIPGFEFIPDATYDANNSADMYNNSNRLMLLDETQSHSIIISLMKGNAALMDEINNHKNSYDTGDDYLFLDDYINGGAYSEGSTKNGSPIYHVSLEKQDPVFILFNDEYMVYISGDYIHDGEIRESFYSFLKTTSDLLIVESSN